MSITTIVVETPSARYDIVIGADLLGSIGERVDALLSGGVAAGKQRVFVVTSPEIWRLHGQELAAGFAVSLTVLDVPAGEQHKRLSTIERLLEELAQHGADRDSILLAFGGGVIGDMTGFLAATYMRGIRYVGVPTTALAQIDSSVGGKTGVNLAAGKNLAGAFHHPLAVYADIATLATLPANELRAGLQEAVKAGIILDRNLFEALDEHSAAILSGDTVALAKVIAAAVRVKADVVSQDEKESGIRMLLNLGHTLGHAIEAATHYNQLLHGEAVAWGMLAAIRIAQQRGKITADAANRMDRVLRTYGPLRSFTADPAELVALTAKDKKNRSGNRSFILPTAIGSSVVVTDVTEAELLDAATTIVTEAAAIEVSA
jgi:3-dehydroquinate synthase